ncbi:hypothetical protein GCM10022254_03570 [Actinomadura meridiana]|uniref:Uncharacterized protein n=1 Tax=Actinomadura meridiana TaxID=559626 RepID=A0ABP8BS29_9ACTN
MKKLLVIPAMAAALTVSVSACGDSDDGPGPAPVAGASTSANPDGGGTITGNGGGGGSMNGGGGTNGSELTDAQKKSLMKVVECMRQKGYDMPEPTSPVIRPKNANSLDADKLNKDSQECATQAAG